MTDHIALIQNNQGEFEIQFDKGRIVREAKELSYAKHNLLCFGRLSKHSTTDPVKRSGFLGGLMAGRQLYSTSWQYYQEGKLTSKNIDDIIREFNASCTRDYNARLLDNKVSIKSAIKLDNYTLLVNIQIGDNLTQLTINR